MEITASYKRLDHLRHIVLDSMCHVCDNEYHDPKYGKGLAQNDKKLRNLLDKLAEKFEKTWGTIKGELDYYSRQWMISDGYRDANQGIFAALEELKTEMPKVSAAIDKRYNAWVEAINELVTIDLNPFPSGEGWYIEGDGYLGPDNNITYINECLDLIRMDN